MRGIGIDFSDWHAMLTTLLGLVTVSFIAVGIRLLFMQVIQKRRERENRQINERLRTLIQAYKVLGGSFTGDLAVDPTHARSLRRMADVLAPAMSAPASDESPATAGAEAADLAPIPASPSLPPARGEPVSDTVAERRRRIRDAVEAALSDIVLLGTEEQVRLAAHAAQELVAGRRVELGALVISLRSFIREALDLDPIPASVTIPAQGPTRPASSGGAGGRGAAGAAGGGAGGRGGGGGGAGGGMGAGMGGLGVGLGLGHRGGAGTDVEGPDAAR